MKHRRVFQILFLCLCALCLWTIQKIHQTLTQDASVYSSDTKLKFVGQDRRGGQDQSSKYDRSSRNLISAFHIYRYFYQRGPFQILGNFIRPPHINPKEIKSLSEESVTFSSVILGGSAGLNSTIRHLPVLASRWRSPISLVIYSHSSAEFYQFLQVISYLIHCSKQAEDIERWTTFHFVFNLTDWPILSENKSLLELTEADYFDADKPCEEKQMFLRNLSPNPKNIWGEKSEDKKKRISNPPEVSTTAATATPLNLLRNVARERAYTKYGIVSDLDLLPGPANFVKLFMGFLRKENKTRKERRVFVLPVYELDPNLREEDFPESRTELHRLIQNGKAKLGTEPGCPECAAAPFFPPGEGVKWLRDKQDPEDCEMNIWGQVKVDHFPPYWQPLYIGRNDEVPLFDERISGDRSCLRKQPHPFFIMSCFLGFKFHVLTNAFFLKYQPPAAKKVGRTLTRDHFCPLEMNSKMRTDIIVKKLLPTYELLYGDIRKGCL